METYFVFGLGLHEFPGGLVYDAVAKSFDETDVVATQLIFDAFNVKDGFFGHGGQVASFDGLL